MQYLVTKQLLDLHDKYDGDLGFLEERWADKRDRELFSAKQMQTLGEFQELLALSQVNCLAPEFRSQVEQRIAELERLIDPDVIAKLRERQARLNCLNDRTSPTNVGRRIRMTPGYNPKYSERFFTAIAWAELTESRANPPSVNDEAAQEEIQLLVRCWDCPCCGVPVECVLVKVFEDDNAIAAAAVHWATHEKEDTILLLVSIGDWNQVSDGEGRLAFGFSCEVGVEQLGMKSIDAWDARISERDNFGKKLTSDAARESTGLALGRRYCVHASI